jgi:hypothetical protein
MPLASLHFPLKSSAAFRALSAFSFALFNCASVGALADLCAMQGCSKDPQTGQPSRLHQSVTVIAPSALDADYHSTLFFLLPTTEIKNRLTAAKDLAVVIVENDGSIFVSENLQQTWQPAKGI